MNKNSQFISVLLILLVVSLLAFVTMPLREKVTAHRLQKETVASQQQLLETQLSDLKSLSQTVTESAATKTALQKAVPEGYGQDALILELSQIASEQELTLSGMGFSPVSEDGRSYLKLALNVSGPYDAFIPFLQGLESADRLIRVNSISVQRTGSEAAVFNINLDAFHQ